MSPDETDKRMTELFERFVTALELIAKSYVVQTELLTKELSR